LSAAANAALKATWGVVLIVSSKLVFPSREDHVLGDCYLGVDSWKVTGLDRTGWTLTAFLLEGRSFPWAAALRIPDRKC
jgi:hypothetical protein